MAVTDIVRRSCAIWAVLFLGTAAFAEEDLCCKCERDPDDPICHIIYCDMSLADCGDVRPVTNEQLRRLICIVIEQMNNSPHGTGKIDVPDCRP